MPQPVPKRLLADDAAGLEIISAAVQDAVCLPSDLEFKSRQRSFSLELNRFHWESAGKRGPYFRSRSLLGFDGVMSVRARGLPAKSSQDVLQLLSISFNEDDAPAGLVLLTFAGGAEIELSVECIDVTLFDTDKIWPSKRRPDHNRKTD